MFDLSRYLFLAGALPFVVLGVAHVLVTPRTPGRARGLSPRDPAVRGAMESDTLLLTGRMTVWSGWVGFNLSHSLGAIVFGMVVLLAGRSQESFQQQAAVFLPFAVIVSALYLLLGLRYWFRVPILGIALSCLCYVASSLLFVIGR